MHTVISAFADRAAAKAAMERLERSGIHRHEMHLEHKEAYGDGTGIGEQRWQGMEREIAVGRGALHNYGAFFASILGVDSADGQVDTYSQHVERGGCVLVVDTADPVEAQRANAILREMGGVDSHVADRTAQKRPLRDIVADRQMTMTGMTTDMENDVEARERAMAAGRTEPRDKPNR